MAFAASLSFRFPGTSPDAHQNPPPIFISTSASHLNLLHLQSLFQSVNLSPERFPRLDENGCVKPVGLDKLRIAVSNSSVVVSVFCRLGVQFPFVGSGERLGELGLGGLIERAMPVTESNGELVGFGRAVSDNALTASIYDVMVIPQLQRMGIGRRIVNRIIRTLTTRGIYDISAISSEKERLFFQACGFGSDILGSTTMVYTRTGSKDVGRQSMAKQAGRLLLLIPPSRELLLPEVDAVD